MLMTLWGIVTLVRLVHWVNAPTPILEMFVLIVILVRLKQDSKAQSSKLVTLLGTVTLVSSLLKNPEEV